MAAGQSGRDSFSAALNKVAGAASLYISIETSVI